MTAGLEGEGMYGSVSLEGTLHWPSSEGVGVGCSIGNKFAKVMVLLALSAGETELTPCIPPSPAGILT